MSTALLKAAAMGPAIRSARRRSASASMRTTFSPMCFMGTEDGNKPGRRKPFTAEYAERTKNLHHRGQRITEFLSERPAAHFSEMLFDHHSGRVFQALLL